MTSNGIDIVKDIIIPLASVGAGAFLGAWFAYFNERKSKLADKCDLECASANKLLVTLATQHNLLINFNETVLKPHENEAGNYIGINAHYITGTEHLSITPDDVSFLFLHDAADLAFSLILESGKFHSAIETIKMRAMLHDKEVQPNLDANLKVDTLIHEDDLRKLMGDRLYYSIKTQTEHMYMVTRLSLESTPKVIDAAHKLFKKIYPDRKFLSIIPVTPNPNSKTAK